MSNCLRQKPRASSKPPGMTIPLGLGSVLTFGPSVPVWTLVIGEYARDATFSGVGVSID
jgi:hypothetical protein